MSQLITPISRTAPSGRHIYAYARTQARADEILADMFATGDAVPGEFRIERITTSRITIFALTQK